MPEAVALESVDAVAAIAADGHDAGRFENVQMAGRGRPAVAEAAGQVPGGQLRPMVRKQQHDLAPGLMGEGIEHHGDVDQ